MSATTTETQNPQAQPAQTPELTVLSRVASIPMISSSLSTINDALSTNSYTCSSYNHAKELSTSAYKLTEPLQVKLTPLLVRADTIANKAVDVVESRYPYPFNVQPQDVKESTTNFVNEQVNNVNKAIDDKVKTPAYNVAHGIDQQFTPIVNYFESAVSRLNNSEAAPSTPDAQYQYQRALALSKTLGENIIEYSNEQLKYFQAQNIIVQKASETASSISSVATSSLASAQNRIHSLSDNMLAELHKLQASTSSLTASLQATIQNPGSQIQSRIPPIQQSYADLTAALSSTVNELSKIVTTKDLPLQEKLARVGKEVHERINPLLETVKKGVSEVLSRSKAEPTPTDSPTTNGTNGDAHPPVKAD
jgi:hypothetical protein